MFKSLFKRKKSQTLIENDSKIYGMKFSILKKLINEKFKTKRLICVT